MRDSGSTEKVLGAITLVVLTPLLILLVIAWWYLLATVYRWFGMGEWVAAGAATVCVVLQFIWLCAAAAYNAERIRTK